MKDKTEQRRMLTEKQEQFLAEHHYLVEDFLKYRGLPMDEFYDVVIFWALASHFGEERSRNEGVQILSLDYQFNDSSLTLGDVIADERVDICGSVCKKLSRPVVKRRRLLHTTPYKNACIGAFAKEAA